MGARYSDRFFGPDGVGGPPPATASESIDLVERTEGDAPAPLLQPNTSTEPRTWHEHAVARTALVCALVAGAGGGAYGWDRWRDHQVDVVARSAVDLTAAASVGGFNETGTEFEVDLLLENNGPYAVTIVDVSAMDHRLSLAAEGWERVALDPGKDLRRPVELAIDCSVAVEADLSDGAAELTARLATVDGSDHELPVDVDYYGGSLSSMVDEQCSLSDGHPEYGNMYAEVSDVKAVDDGAVTAAIVLHSPYVGGSAAIPQTYDVVPASLGFATVIDNSVEDPSTGSWVVRVVWSVLDCPLALTATDVDMSIDLTGQISPEATPGTLTAFPSPALTVALARLSERVCG